MYALLLYLDPTTGGVLLQAILGGATGILVLVRLFWGRLRSLVERNKSRQPQDESPKTHSSGT